VDRVGVFTPTGGGDILQVTEKLSKQDHDALRALSYKVINVIPYNKEKPDKKRLLKNRRTIFIGLVLPTLWIGAFSFLVLLSLINIKVSSIIAADKLILLTVMLSPIIYILGAIVSITALFKSEMKKIALIGVTLNIVALLIALLCLGSSIFIEVKLVI
jgi:hypothetical protein